MQNTISINGRVYDASTGKLLKSGYNKTHKSAAPSKPQGVVFDVTKGNKTHKTHLDPPSNPHHTKTHNTTSNHHQNSQNIVKKPVGSLINPSHDIEKSDRRWNFLRKPSGSKQKLAQQVPTSSKIKKFANPIYYKAKLTPGLTTAIPPQETSTPPAIGTTSPVKKGRKKTKQEVFIHRIIEANTHLAPKAKKQKLRSKIAHKLKTSPKAIGLSAASLAIIFLAGFLAYQNIPSVAMRVAANRAGFSGHLPGDIPSGFSFKGPIFFTKGTISLNYKSNSDGRVFAITQKPTNWTSETLLTNFLLASKLQYQTFHDKGLTVYIYDEGAATWVDKGVWYSINSEGSLSSDQILTIASSM